MTCSKCGSENSPNAKFCRGCGSKLEVGKQVTVGDFAECSKCGHTIKLGKKFCTKCGAPVGMISALIAEAKAVEEAQRKSDEQARLEAEAKAKAEKQARLEAEAKLAEDARIKAEEEAKAKAAERARIAEAKAIEDAQRKADERARLEAEAKAKAEKQAHLEAEAKLAEGARIKAEEEAKAKAAERAHIAEAKAIEDAQRKADEQARLEAEAKAKAEKQARLEAEGKAGAELAEHTSATRGKLIVGAIIAMLLLCTVAGGSYWYFNKQETIKDITEAKQPEPVGAQGKTAMPTPVSEAATTVVIKQPDNNIPQPNLNENLAMEVQTAQVKPIAIPDKNEQEGTSARLNGILRNAISDNWISVDSDIKKLRDVAPQLISNDMAGNRVNQDKGKQALHQQDYPNAIVYFSAAADSSPNDTESLNGLGYALLRNRNIDKAEIIIKRALRLQPESGAAWANVAEVFAEKGNPDASLAALMVAIHFSANRQKTISYLKNVVSTSDSQKFSLVIRKVLPMLDSIPQATLK